MKKWLAGLLALALLCTFGCRLNRDEAAVEPESAPDTQETSAPIEEPTPVPTEAPSCLAAILGDWEIASVEIGGTVHDPEAVGMQSELSFYPNGAGKLNAWVGEDMHGGVFVYTVSGNTITLVDEENDGQTVTYDPITDTLRMEHEDAAVVFVRKADTLEPAPEATPEPTETPDWRSVQLDREEDDAGRTMIVITAAIPAGATLRILFSHQDDYSYTNAEDVLKLRRVKIPVEVFFPNEPLDRTTLTITPQVTVTTADGTEHAVACPSFTHTFPMLLLAFDSDGEASEGAYNVRADRDGVYHLYGMMLSSEEGMPSVDAGVRLTVNGAEIAVYQGGIFFADLGVIDNAPTTYTLIAEKDNYMTVTVDVIVSPVGSDV